MELKRTLARRLLEDACDLYEQGLLRKAAAVFQKAARLGDPYAQTNLANLYDSGKGVRLNQPRARYWYRRAARRGVAEAAYNLAISYQHAGDQRWMKHWMKSAAKMGDKDAAAAVRTLAGATSTKRRSKKTVLIRR
jgi:TPR repeat protein